MGRTRRCSILPLPSATAAWFDGGSDKGSAHRAAGVVIYFDFGVIVILVIVI
jgi:hypothetical protein